MAAFAAASVVASEGGRDRVEHVARRQRRARAAPRAEPGLSPRLGRCGQRKKCHRGDEDARAGHGFDAAPDAPARLGLAAGREGGQRRVGVGGPSLPPVDAGQRVERVGVGGIGVGGGAQRLDRLVRPVRLFQHRAEMVLRRRGRRIDADGLAQQRLGLLVGAAAGQRAPEVDGGPWRRIGGEAVQADRFAILRDRQIDLVQRLVAEAEVVERARETTDRGSRPPAGGATAAAYCPAS